MNATQIAADPVTLRGIGNTQEGQVRLSIRQLMAELYPATPVIERRRDPRYPFPQLIRLTPVAPDGTPLIGPAPIVVIGKHISERGLAFFHQQPLPYRRAFVSFETRDRAWLTFLIDLHWCRFNRLGWYEGGGRLLKQVTSAVAA